MARTTSVRLRRPHKPCLSSSTQQKSKLFVSNQVIASTNVLSGLREGAEAGAAFLDDLGKQCMKGPQSTRDLGKNVSPHDQNFHGGPRTDAGTARLIIKQRHLPKKIARTENVQEGSRCSPVCCLQYFNLTPFNGVKIHGRLSLPEDVIPRLIVGSRDALGRLRFWVGQITGKEQVPDPIKSHLGTSRPGRQLQQIDTTPE